MEATHESHHAKAVERHQDDALQANYSTNLKRAIGGHGLMVGRDDLCRREA